MKSINRKGPRQARADAKVLRKDRKETNIKLQKKIELKYELILT
jgi:hypothetical protein